MIDCDYIRLMARYNAEMNRRWLAAAGRLTEDQRRADRGAFFGSIHGTFNHLLWADRVWLSRLTGSAPPDHPRADSAQFVRDWGALVALRLETDRALLSWAETVTLAFLRQPVHWFAGTPAAFESTQALCVVHMFTHQTHHRGQIHALLTGFGQDTDATSVWVLQIPGLSEPMPEQSTN